MSLLSALTMVMLPLAAYGRHDGGWPWLFPPFFLLFWIAVGFLVFRCVRGGRRRPPRSGIDTARDILAARFAEGEIDADEYHQRLSQLH